MKSFNILIVHNYYQIPGGEDSVVLSEKELLEQHGHNVLLYTRNNKELTTMTSVYKMSIPFKAIFNPQSYFDIKKIIIENKIDVVHVHNTLHLISPAVYYAAKSCKVPVVQTMHNFRLLCPGATFYRDGHICEDCLTKGLLCAVRNSCYRGSKLQTIICSINTKIHRMTRIYGTLNYICLTDFNREKLLELKQIKKEKVFVKPNCVKNTDRIVPNELRKRQIVFAGRLDKLKGVEMMLRTWKLMGENAPRLIICGTGPMEKWCKNFIDNNQLTNIEMTGLISNCKVKKLVASSKALILPTLWYEGFPMSIVEAYSMGTPVICSDLGNAGRIVVNGITGFKFKPNSEIELASAVKRVMKTDYIHKTTLEEYLKHYTSENNYKMLINIYKKIITY